MQSNHQQDLGSNKNLGVPNAKQTNGADENQTYYQAMAI